MMKTYLSIVVALSTVASVAADWPVVKTYEGEFLRRVKMPLGGIGTGTISLSGTGGLVDWEIMGGPNKGFTPAAGVSPFFAIRTETPDGDVKAGILEGPLNSEDYEGHSGARARNHGFTRWRGCAFKAAYPLAQVALEDAQMPVKATLEAMNPLIPGDADRSGIPAALLRWKVANASASPLKASVICFLVNPAPGTNQVARLAEGGLQGVRMSATGSDIIKCGETALVLPQACGTVTSATDFDDSNWKRGFDGIWRAFVESGKAQDYADEESKGKKRALAVRDAVFVRAEAGRDEVLAVRACVAFRAPVRLGADLRRQEGRRRQLVRDALSDRVRRRAGPALEPG